MLKLIECRLIAYYMNLAKSIYRHERMLKEIRIGFFNQTMSSYTTSNGEEVFSIGFNVEENVIHLVDGQRKLESTLEICRFKHKHFTAFLHTLQHADRIYLKERYLQEEEVMNERVDQECSDMIQEIEEAVSYRFLGTEPAAYIDDAPDIDQVSEEEFEEAFDNALVTMINRLGG